MDAAWIIHAYHLRLSDCLIYQQVEYKKKKIDVLSTKCIRVNFMASISPKIKLTCSFHNRNEVVRCPTS